MKYFYIFLLFNIWVVSSYAQPSDFISHMDSFAGEKGFIVLNINDASSVLREMVKNKSALETIKTVKKLSMIRFSKNELNENEKKNPSIIGNGSQFCGIARKYRPSGGFEELMSLSQGSNFMRSFYKKSDKNENEFIMTIVSDDEDCLMMYMSGNFTKDQIIDIAKSISQNM